jgi:choice-of-anchor A domain-containing protein
MVTDTLFVGILLVVAIKAVAMGTSRHLTLTALGLCLFLGCSADKSGSGHGDVDDPSGSGGNGAGAGKGSGANTRGGNGSAGNGTSGNRAGAGGDDVGGGGENAGGAPSTGGVGNGTNTAGSGATAGNTASGNAGNGTGPNGSVGGNTSIGIGGSGNTEDPPTKGGTGSTGDPPPQGGTGNTGDPPGQGGTGNTGDPPGQGGTGNTGDPPGQGGTGNTGDPPGQGGTGNTGDPPGQGGTGNTGDPVGGASSQGGSGGTGGSGTTGDPPPAGCVPKEIDRVNVVVFSDAKPTGADSEGAMWVGGTLEPASGNYSVAAGALADLTCSDWGLVVGGAVTGSVVVKTGKVAIGGTNNVATGSACGVYKQKPVNFTTLESNFLSYSAKYASYPANGTVSGSLVFTGTNKTLNVFNVTSEQLDAASGITILAPLDSSVIVNVAGKKVAFNNKGFTLPDGGSSCKAGTSAWCHRILWNFYEAETISATGIGIEGSVLAPKATFNTGSGMVDGQVIVKYLNGAFEYHPYFFKGCLLLPTD